MKFRSTLLHILVTMLVTHWASTLMAQSLVVTRAEPPNWWVGMKRNRVQLMIYGEHLRGIKAAFDDDRLVVEKVLVPANDDYAFIDVTIPANVDSGTYRLRLTREGDVAEIEFPILDRLGGDRHRGFGPSDVIYLITPDRFANGDPSNDRVAGILDDFDPNAAGSRHGGDLQGLIGRLDYLKDLGVTTIWLNPILENNGVNSYHGYKATNLYRIDPRFGSNDLYRQFVAECHQRGLKVIFDHVSNHIGIRHPWIENLPAKDWLNGDPGEHLRDKHFKLSITDPHADDNSANMLKTFWFVDRMPDLNQRNTQLANYLIQNSIWWIEYAGLDGIREDTYPYADQSFLAQWAKEILAEYPRFNIVGEVWASSPAYIAQFQKVSHIPRRFETNLPAVMDFPLAEALRDFVAGEGKLKDVYETYAQDFLYSDPDNLVVFVDNHDMPRAIFLADGDDRRVRVALAIMLFARGIPQLLYGTEINMLGGQRHVDLRADFPGGFPQSTRDAFEAAGRTEGENSMFNYLRSLLHLRRQHPALSKGRMIHFPVWNNDLYMILKIHEQGTVLVVANGDDQAREVDLSDLRQHLEGVRLFRDLLTRQDVPWDGRSTLRIGALGCLIYEIRK